MSPGPFSLGYSTMQFSPRLVAEPPGIFEQVNAAAAAGFEWCAVDRHTLRVVEVAGELERLGEICAERLPCRELQALVIGDGDDFEKQIDRLGRQAAALGPERIVVAVKCEPDATVAAQLTDAAACLAGVRLAIEVSPLFAVATIAAGVELCGDLPGAGLVIDSWHFFHGDDGWDELRALPGRLLAGVHFSDHGVLGPDGIQVEKNRRRLPGDGHFDLERFVAEVSALGYRGGVEIEVISEDLRGLGPAGFAAAAYTAGARYWTRDVADQPTDEMEGR